METSASFEARSAPLPYPTANQRTYGSVRGAPGNRYPYRDRLRQEWVAQCGGAATKRDPSPYHPFPLFPLP
jgi:hypothetical protein